jgi:uncharacterized integral membrane protein
MSRFLFILSLVIAAAAAVFVSAMNAGRVDIELAFAHFDSPLGLALVITFTLGMLIGLFWRVSWIARLLNERGRLRRALRLAEDRARSQSDR